MNQFMAYKRGQSPLTNHKPYTTQLNPIELNQFALIENLAHTSLGAYGAPKRQGNEIIQIKDINDGTIYEYQVIKLKTNSAGLVGEILVPVQANQ